MPHITTTYHHIYTIMNAPLPSRLSLKLCALLVVHYYGRATADATPTTSWIASPPGAAAGASPTVSPPRCFGGSMKSCRPNNTRYGTTATTTMALPKKQPASQRARRKVTRLAMNQRLNFEPENTEGLGQPEEMNISDGGDGGEEEPRLAVPGLPSLSITREQLIIAGWSGFLGVAYAGGREDQKSYSARKRRLFGSIAGDNNVRCNLFESVTVCTWYFVSPCPEM